MFMFAALLGGAVAMNACKPDGPEPGPAGGDGTVVGTVTDEATGDVIDGVTVTIGTKTALTDVDGKYSITGVPVATGSVSFVKEGYESTSTPLSKSSFNSEKVATANAKMRDASYQISGTVRDGNNGGVGLAGVTVSITGGASTTTDENGEYVLANLALDNYTLSFSKETFTTRTRTIAKADFNEDKIATMDVTFGGGVLLPPAKTAEDLRSNVQIWRYNEYRGGNSSPNPPFDWSQTNIWTFMVEGDPITSDNYAGVRVVSDPINPENNPDPSSTSFDSYMYGRKLITEDNKILTVLARSSDDSAINPDLIEWGVQVINITAGDPENKQIRAAGQAQDNVRTATLTVIPYNFDLSDYVGQEVIIAIGIFRLETGNYNRNLIIKRILFTPAEPIATEVESTFTLGGGTAVAGLEGWFMTEEMVRSTMVQDKTEFAGITVSGSNRYEQFSSWYTNAHIGWEWSLMPLHKDTEPTVSQGYLIKCRGAGVTNLVEPECYTYAKFKISSANDKFTLWARNDFGTSDWTHFRLTAVDASDMTVTHLPLNMTESTSGQGVELTPASDNVIRFKNNSGDGDGPDAYGKFVYDLSGFTGKDVVLILGVYKGDDTSTTENKLCMYGMKFE